MTDEDQAERVYLLIRLGQHHHLETRYYPAHLHLRSPPVSTSIHMLHIPIHLHFFSIQTHSISQPYPCLHSHAYNILPHLPSLPVLISISHSQHAHIFTPFPSHFIFLPSRASHLGLFPQLIHPRPSVFAHCDLGSCFVTLALILPWSQVQSIGGTCTL